jgi:glycerate dehydrogenase
MCETIVFLDRDTTDRGDIDLSEIESLGKLVYHGTTHPSEVNERIAVADIILTNKVVIKGEEMDAASNLKLIQIVATGVNNVDLDAARQRGLAVCNVSGYSTESVVQHVFASLLNLETNAHRFAAEKHLWPDSPIFTRLDYPINELCGKTLGIVGLGAIGKAVARVGTAFGMNIVALARKGVSIGAITRLPKKDFFAVSDVVTLHCPLTPQTLHFINSETLGMMKSSAILINTGRGDLINEPHLVTALKNGTIRAAAVDVVTPEPPPADHPLIAAALNNLFVTPHTAWSSIEARQRLVDKIVDNIEAFRRSEKLNRII